MTKVFRDPIHPGFPGTVLVSCIKTAVYQCSPKFSSRSQKSRAFPDHLTTDKGYEYFGFPNVGGNTYRSWASINQPLTGRNRKARCVDKSPDCGGGTDISRITNM